jgi:hypothetical protein
MFGFAAGFFKLFCTACPGRALVILLSSAGSLERSPGHESHAVAAAVRRRTFDRPKQINPPAYAGGYRRLPGQYRSRRRTAADLWQAPLDQSAGLRRRLQGSARAIRSRRRKAADLWQA